MSNKQKTICIFGGAGFIGHNITQELARAGFRIKVATRYPESAYALKPCGDVGQVVAMKCDYRDEDSIADVIKGSDAVINLVGVLYETRKNKFIRVHSELPEMIARLSKEQGVAQFIHVSALGIAESQSKYAKSKLSGEEALLEQYCDATVLRPSVVFGAGDNFFNMFAKMATMLPALPLIGGGQTKFQPVYVGDIADAIINILTGKAGDAKGKIYELAGPEVVSFKEIYQILLDEINRDRKLMPVPWAIAKIQGAVLGLLPKPLLTIDQVRSLKFDNVKDKDSLGLNDLAVEPTAMRVILPRYLFNYKKGGRFANKKAA